MKNICFLMALLIVGVVGTMGACSDSGDALSDGGQRIADAADGGQSMDGSSDGANADECLYNGEIYHTGDVFPATDGCNTCSCNPEGTIGVGCSLKDCGDAGVLDAVAADAS